MRFDTKVKYLSLKAGVTLKILEEGVVLAFIPLISQSG